MFNQKVSPLHAFINWPKDEVHHQLLAKGALLIKDAQSLNHLDYSTFISSLVVLRKSL